MPSILRPKAVRTGDLVAVAALSGGLEKGEASLFERGVEAIEQMGSRSTCRQWWTRTGGGGGRPRRPRR